MQIFQVKSGCQYGIWWLHLQLQFYNYDVVLFLEDYTAVTKQRNFPTLHTISSSSPSYGPLKIRCRKKMKQAEKLPTSIQEEAGSHLGGTPAIRGSWIIILLTGKCRDIDSYQATAACFQILPKFTFTTYPTIRRYRLSRTYERSH